MQDPLFIGQLLAGRDFGTQDPVARQMQNCVYLIGDRDKRECLVVDPAWDVAGILDAAAARDLEVVGALITHWHPDHVGGALMGHDVEGLPRFLELQSCPVYVHEGDVAFVKMMTGLGDAEITVVRSGDTVKAGDVEVECLHTPGHTEGSQCFRCGKALVAGDTLFLDGCGRTDFPGGDTEEMWRTLYERLLALPADLVLYPGHDYGDKPHAPLEEVRRTNRMLQTPRYEDFVRLRGG